MSRYIDAEKIIETISSRLDMQDLYLPVHFLDLIDDIPTADVEEVRHGKWVNDQGNEYRCSGCGYSYINATSDGNYNYCPNCGAKMDGGD